VFYFTEVPAETVKTILLSTHEEISEDFDNWDEYSTFYGKDVPNHTKQQRCPCMVPMSEPELVFEDGWHRLHSYINQGHTTIPIVQY